MTTDLRWFFSQVARKKGKLPLVAVIEEGGANGRLHVHFACDRFLSIEAVRKWWHRGHVFVGDPRKLPDRVPPRKLASYLSKYVSKQLDEVSEEGAKQRARGEHRYLISQGHSPSRVTLRYQRPEHALERLTGLYGKPDVLIAFGDPRVDVVYGWWLSFPDRYLHPPPGTLRPG